MRSDPEQGPQAGRRWAPETRTYTDSVTGADVTRVTSSRAHDHHCYFTRSGWYDGGDRLLFASDRSGAPDLYSLDVDRGRITQLTDLPSPAGDRGFRGYSFPFQFTSLNPDRGRRGEAYFWHGDALLALDLDTLSLRTLYEKPGDYLSNMTHYTADGEAVCTIVFEDVRSGIPRDVGWTPMQRKGSGYETFWRSAPRSKVLEIPVDGRSEASVLHEEDRWLAHLNASPTRPELLTFCQYGPWTEIDHRAWGLDRESGEVWKIRPEAPDGTPSPPTMHEYWLADGETLGYYGRDGDGDPIYGTIRYDNADQVEIPVHGETGKTLPHFHSHTEGRVVSDGNGDVPCLHLWEGESTADLGEPRLLARHDCSSHTQVSHVHPRFGPDDSTVVYTSDRSGYANVYLVDVPPLGSLPTPEEA